MPHIRPQILVDTGLLLSDLGILDAQNAEICGVAIKTIRRWRRLYQRQGRMRGQAANYAPCPRCGDGVLDRAAYAELLGWYLGDGHIAWSGARRIPLLAIFNDAKYADLNAHLIHLMAAVKPGGSPHQRRMPGAIATACGWKHWPCLFPQHGPGRKHKRAIVLAPWQQQIVEQHPGRFLRGLFHSDGCRITNWTTRPVRGGVKRYEYPRYFFSNASADIRGLCCWALGLLDIAHTHPSERTISVARKEAVAVLDVHVGPKS